MACQSPTPVPLSGHAELERQEHVAAALARLLSAAPGVPAATAEAVGAAAAPRKELEAWLEEIEELRCAVHLADLEKCRSQQRSVAVSYAIVNDAALRQEEIRLSESTESARQQFFNDIHDRIKRGDFSSFAFKAVDFNEFWQAERAARAASAAGSTGRLAELEGLSEPCLRQCLAECGEAIASFPWASLSAGPSGAAAVATRLDALTMERPDDLWFVAESWSVAQDSDQAEPQKAVSCRPATPRDLMLVVDLSGSMCDVLPLLQECLHETLARAREADRLCVIGFSSEPKVLCEWTQLQSVDSRRVVRECVGAMCAHGGTRLVPALELIGQQLRSLPDAGAGEGAAPRPPAVVLLSDGDPEEPAEAISSAALRAFAEHPDVTVVSLALGEESRPDLMALLAQSGRGASLYIAGHSQLPPQLGRMWGLLGGREAQAAAATAGGPSAAAGGRADRSSVADMFLVLEPAEGVEVLEAERPPGGAVSLAGDAGRQIVALRCGQHSATGLARQRLAARLRLPHWLKAPVDDSTLQRPLLRATWVWRHGETGSVHATSEVLRVVQVPSLLVEAKLGLPLRIVLAADAANIDSFDREAFLATLAVALGVKREDLVLGRLSPGSIIADLCLLNPQAPGINKACLSCLSAGSMDAGIPAAGGAKAGVLQASLATAGHDVKDAALPGAAALHRALQWRLAAALEAAALGAPEAPAALAGVQELAACGAAQAYAGHPDLPGAAAAAAADAAAAASALASAAGGRPTPAVAHGLEQQAHAHCQQVCPELAPSAAAVRCYETEAVRQAALAFEATAALRESAPPMAALELAAESEAKPGSIAVSVRAADAGDGAVAAVVAFAISCYCGEKVTTTEVPIRAGTAGKGTLVHVAAIEDDAEHALVVAASNGRSWGPKCEPLLCRAPTSPSSPSRASRGALRRSSSRHTVRRGPSVEVSEAAATALGTLLLRWEVWPASAACFKWTVALRAYNPTNSDATEQSSTGISECLARFTGLSPSAAYSFSILPEVSVEEPVSSTPSSGADPFGLTIQGTAVVRSAPPAPHGAEGVVVIPPYPSALLKELKANVRLRACGPGLFVANSGGALGAGTGRAA